MYTRKLPDKFIVALYHEAKRQKRPMTQVMKDAVRDYLAKKKKKHD